MIESSAAAAGMFSFGAFAADMGLVLKIFVLLTIISFVRNHVGNSPLGWVLIAVFSWFVLFDYWKFFGGLYILYILLAWGVGSLIIDYVFVSGMGGGAQAAAGEEHSPVSSGVDINARMEAVRRIQQQMGRRRMGR